MEEIKSILANVIRDIEKNQQQFFKEDVESVWVKCVKKTIAEHTKVYSLRKSKLYVNIENPAWLFELNIKKEKILEQLQKLSKNKIKEVMFRVGNINGK